MKRKLKRKRRKKKRKKSYSLVHFHLRHHVLSTKHKLSTKAFLCNQLFGSAHTSEVVPAFFAAAKACFVFASCFSLASLSSGDN
jgi:hypothetical protein